MSDRHEQDKLIIKTLRGAIACAWLVMACTVISVVINTCGKSCPPCQAEKP